MNLKTVITTCEEMLTGCRARTVKDLGRHYGVAMGSIESRYVGGMILFVDKKTGKIEVGRRREKPAGSVPYLFGKIVWESPPEATDNRKV